VEEGQGIIVVASFTRKAFCRPKIDHYEETGKKLFLLENCTY
jgi:hypothetical protein